MAGNFVIAKLDAANQRIIINVQDAAGDPVAGTGQITLDLTLLTGTDKDMRPREVIYKDAECNWKRRWVLCTAEEDYEP